MLELLEQIFRRVRTYIRSEQLDRHTVYARTSDHVTMQFDHDAEDIIIQGLSESGLGFEIVSEERPPCRTTPTPEYRIIIDPVDGSNNIRRGIKTAGVALAVLPIDAPILPEQVQWALVGELFSGTIYQAQRAQGAFCNGKRCHVSDVKRLKTCTAGVNFDGRNLATLHTFLESAPSALIRRTGSSAVDSVYVASGAYDLYLDAGNVLTGESFLASASIVLEAGGVVSDTQGKPLAPITNLTQGFPLLVASTQELHAEVIAAINQGNVR
jgi:myo-inositol-1(or 4)-monophosphatase